MELKKNCHKPAANIGNCCTTPILATKTQYSTNNNLFKSDFREFFLFFLVMQQAH